MAAELQLDLKLVLSEPPPMMNSVERSLLSFGVPGRQIIAERFKYD